MLVACAISACAGSGVTRSTLELVQSRPHDRSAYTQGLVILGDRLYESTGLYGESSIREVDLVTGAVLAIVQLDDGYFGEGLAVVDDRLIQLTWHENTALIWDIGSMTQVGTFAYETEGWGLCDDGTRLVMSDGSSTLYFRDRDTFELRGTVAVTNDGSPADMLNELECVGGDVYANVYQTSDIVRIDPTDGQVTAVIDASSLLAEPGTDAGVLNGIAYDAASGTFLLTGKNWPALFEVRFLAASLP